MTGGPDFLGIGMERAGSSWLFYMLASHPDVWVPPIKELHYFDSIDPASKEKNWRFKKHAAIRLKGKLAPFVKKPEDRPQFFKNSYIEYLEWDWRYFTGGNHDQWYKSLFDQKFTKGRISGEATAAYSTLSENMIEHVCSNFPQTKFLLSIRDPADRTKSSLLHFFCGVQKRNIENCTESELLEWLDDPLVLQRSSAAQIIDVWSKHAGEGRLHLIDFSCISREPLSVIEKLYGFLQLRCDFLPPQSLIGEKIFSFSDKAQELPEAVLDKIYSLHEKERKKIQIQYPHLANHWKYL